MANNQNFLRKVAHTILFLLFFVPESFGQRVDLDLFGGFSNYQGDLQPAGFTTKLAKPAGSIVLKYSINDNFYLRAGAALGSIEGDDKGNSGDLLNRNLSFQSDIKEIHAGIEYRFIKPARFKLSPYIFAGIGIFHFSPYTTYQGKTYFLQPLGTEGQGLPQYPNEKIYALTQFSIPCGIGLKWQINDLLNVGIEFGQRILFTDHLDDVSSSYADETVLRNARGQIAVDLAYRRIEINPAKPYPAEGTRRGNPGQYDWFYLTGITLGIRLYNNNNKSEPGLGCPRNVW